MIMFEIATIVLKMFICYTFTAIGIYLISEGI